MKDCCEILENIYDDLNLVCDSTGIVRTLILARMYNAVKELSTALKNAETEWKNEKLKLEAEIQDLKEAAERSK